MFRALFNRAVSFDPPHFRRVRDLNIEGPPPIQNAVREVPPTEFGELVDEGAVTVIDTREPGAFASSHVYGSLNIWLDGMSFFPGWALEDLSLIHISEPT